MRQRHWDALSAALAIDLHPDETFTLDQAINKLKLQERMDVISKEGERAGKEYMIEQSLNKMQDAWANIRFDVCMPPCLNQFVFNVGGRSYPIRRLGPTSSKAPRSSWHCWTSIVS